MCAIARMRQATRPSLHRFASRRNSADERSRRVNSIAWAIIPSCESNPTHSESEQLRQGNLTTSHDFGRLVLHAAKITHPPISKQYGSSYPHPLHRRADPASLAEAD